ncbi:MAG: S4 domain-containing protein [Woeseiaceae bacterium]|nr:S4 domain-containing protein [Woeseiaceae bacterium]
MADRVQKVLAAAGHGSRREIEGWIREGRLTIDGRVAALGDTVEGQEQVALDGRRLAQPRRAAADQHIMYHEPAERGQRVARTRKAGEPCLLRCPN